MPRHVAQLQSWQLLQKDHTLESASCICIAIIPSYHLQGAT